MKKNIRNIMGIIIVIVTIICLNKIYIKKIYSFKYIDKVNSYAKIYDVDSLLVMAMIKTESNFDEKSVSNSNAKGLMQIMDSTADEIAKKLGIESYDVFDIDTNINMGIYYIDYLIKYYNGNIDLALAAYNAGIGNVNNWITEGTINSDGSNIECIPFKETENYVRKVERDYKIYKKLYE